MGSFTVEARSESFCLGCHRDHLAIAPDRAWSIPIDRVRAHPAYAAAPPEPGHTAWYQVERREQRVHVRAYLGDAFTQDRPYKAVEVEYRHLNLYGKFGLDMSKQLDLGPAPGAEGQQSDDPL